MRNRKRSELNRRIRLEKVLAQAVEESMFDGDLSIVMFKMKLGEIRRGWDYLHATRETRSIINYLAEKPKTLGRRLAEDINTRLTQGAKLGEFTA